MDDDPRKRDTFLDDFLNSGSQREFEARRAQRSIGPSYPEMVIPTPLTLLWGLIQNQKLEGVRLQHLSNPAQRVSISGRFAMAVLHRVPEGSATDIIAELYAVTGFNERQIAESVEGMLGFCRGVVDFKPGK